MPVKPKRSHYIMHIGFCCSTLLARYFELAPNCLVLKEPRLLTQIAFSHGNLDRSGKKEMLDLTVRLLTRTYKSDDFIVIKAHEPCNALVGEILLSRENCSATFQSVSLVEFLLATLKAEERREWARRRVTYLSVSGLAGSELSKIESYQLSDSEAAAYLWLYNRALRLTFCGGSLNCPILHIDGADLACSPTEVLHALNGACKFGWDNEFIEWMIHHPTMQRHAKSGALPFGGDSRKAEMRMLQGALKNEVVMAVEWACKTVESLPMHEIYGNLNTPDTAIFPSGSSEPKTPCFRSSGSL